MIRRLATRRQRAERRKQDELLERYRPRPAMADDSFIVAFPKSGGTWFSYLIANVNILVNELPVELTWWNLREYVFDVGRQRDLPPSPFALPHGRFVHTHSLFNKTYQRVLYLVRDPRDVLVSYYDMARKNGAFHGDMDTFLADKAWGTAGWNEHVQSWLRHTALSFIQFFRYEDLKANPVAVLERIYKLYGLTVGTALLEEAVQRSSFAVMRQHEMFYREKSYDPDTNFTFMRKGVAGGFSDGLTPAQTARIEEQCAEGMRTFGYLPKLPA